MKGTNMTDNFVCYSVSRMPSGETYAVVAEYLEGYDIVSEHTTLAAAKAACDMRTQMRGKPDLAKHEAEIIQAKARCGDPDGNQP
jgi:hypothetical protein